MLKHVMAGTAIAKTCRVSALAKTGPPRYGTRTSHASGSAGVLVPPVNDDERIATASLEPGDVAEPLCPDNQDTQSGRERPSGTAPGRKRPSTRGVAHAPTADTSRRSRRRRTPPAMVHFLLPPST